MRKQGSGTIINIGSLGGRVGLCPFLTQYHASKFALEGFTESLRQELAKFGVNIVLIEPGVIRSNFINNSKTAKNYNPENSPYASTIQKFFEGSQSITADSSHPRDVAASDSKSCQYIQSECKIFCGKRRRICPKS